LLVKAQVGLLKWLESSCLLLNFRYFWLTGAKRREFSGMLHWLTINFILPATPKPSIPIHSLRKTAPRRIVPGAVNCSDLDVDLISGDIGADALLIILLRCSNAMQKPSEMLAFDQ
jgi:hypothetical protein